MNYQNFKIIIIILLNLISKLKENKLVHDYEKRNNEDLKNKNFFLVSFLILDTVIIISI